jgi:hypothetical protein
MFNFFKRNALSSDRKLDRRIHKLQKSRDRYVEYCDIMVGDVENFISQLNDVSKKMRDTIDKRKKAEKIFSETYDEYVDDGCDECEFEEDGECFEDDSDMCECEECDCSDSDKSCKQEEKKSSNETKKKKVIDFAEKKTEKKESEKPKKITFNNFKRSEDAAAIDITRTAMKEEYTYEQVLEAFNECGFKESVVNDHTTSFLNNRIIVTHNDATTEDDDTADFPVSIEFNMKVPVIKHGDYHMDIFKDLGYELVEDTKVRKYSNGDEISKLYFAEGGANGLIVQITVNSSTKNVNISIIDIAMLDDESFDELIKD